MPPPLTYNFDEPNKNDDRDLQFPDCKEGHTNDTADHNDHVELSGDENGSKQVGVEVDDLKRLK